jgi:hypothetical protein
MTDVVGLVPLAAREALALRPLNGVPLLVHAVRALRDVTGSATTVLAGDVGSAVAVLARFDLDDVDVSGYEELGHRLDLSGGMSLLVHDPLCPLLDRRALATVSRLAAGGVVAGVLELTDTVKQVRRTAGRTVVVGTVDRTRLRSVSSPVSIPGQAVPELRRRLGDRAWLDDLGVVVRALRSFAPVSLVDMPSIGRRVDDEGSLLVLESLAMVRLAAQER